MKTSSIWLCCALTSYCLSLNDDQPRLPKEITDAGNQESFLQPEKNSFMPPKPISPEAKLYSRNLKSLKEKIGKILKEKIRKDGNTKTAVRTLLAECARNCYNSANKNNRIDLRGLSKDDKHKVPYYFRENLIFCKLMNLGIFSVVLNSNMMVLNTVLTFSVQKQKMYSLRSNMAFGGVAGDLYVLFKEVNNKMLIEEKNQQNSDFREIRRKLELKADSIMSTIIKILYRCNLLLHYIEAENKTSISELIKSLKFRIFYKKMKGFNIIFRSKCQEYISIYEELYKNESSKKFLTNNPSWLYYILTVFGSIESLNTLLSDLETLHLKQDKIDQVVLNTATNLTLHALEDGEI